MPCRFWLRQLTWILGIGLALTAIIAPANAAVDPYVARYLKVIEPVSLQMNEQESRSFSPEELSQGKKLFEQNCLSCHVGGTTLPDPTVPLSLSALQGATPERDTVNSLVAFLRQPMTYDGSEEAVLCQRIPASWLATPEVEAIAGFVLRAAHTAPGWGTEDFRD